MKVLGILPGAVTLVGLVRAGTDRLYHGLTQWYYLLARRWFQVLFGLAYVAAVGSIGHFLWRTGTYPTTLEFALLVVVLICYLLVALFAAD